MIQWFWSNQFPAINSRKGNKNVCHVDNMMSEGTNDPERRVSQSCCKRYGSSCSWHGTARSLGQRERWDKAQKEEREANDPRLQFRGAQALSLPLQHTPPATWAVGLSTCAHRGLGSSRKPHNMVSGSLVWQEIHEGGCDDKAVSVHPQHISVDLQLSLTREDISALEYKKFWLMACEVLLVSQCLYLAVLGLSQLCSSSAAATGSFA